MTRSRAEAPRSWKLGTAPVSYGIYGLEITHVGAAVDADALLDSMAAAGYDGTELGPPGLFGAPAELRDRFARTGLQVIGAYVPLHLSDPSELGDDLDRMRGTLAELAAAPNQKPLAILADVGTLQLMEHPARPWYDRRLALDDQRWATLADGIRHATALADDYAVETSFHPHISTFVESPWEVERLLAITDVSLTLDTGHLFLAGVTAVECFQAWVERINHIHLKDVRIDVMRDAQTSRGVDFDSWWDRTCVPLGTGDVDLVPFLEQLDDSTYRGWIVIEQDRPPSPVSEYAEIAQIQANNLTWLENHVQRLRGTRPTDSPLQE